MKNKYFPLFLYLCFFLSCSSPSPVATLDGQLLQKYQEAKINYYDGALLKAEKGFREITEKRGDFFQAFFMLGKTLFSLGKTAEAENIFRSLIERYPQYHEAYIWITRAEIANNKIDAAEKRLKILLAFDSSDTRILSLYAKMSEAKNDTTSALRYYQLSTQCEEEIALNRYEIARYYFQFGLEEKALIEIDRCLLLLLKESTLRNAVINLKNTILGKIGDK